MDTIEDENVENKDDKLDNLAVSNQEGNTDRVAREENNNPKLLKQINDPKSKNKANIEISSSVQPQQNYKINAEVKGGNSFNLLKDSNRNIQQENLERAGNVDQQTTNRSIVNSVLMQQNNAINFDDLINNMPLKETKVDNNDNKYIFENNYNNTNSSVKQDFSSEIGNFNINVNPNANVNPNVNPNANVNVNPSVNANFNFQGTSSNQGGFQISQSNQNQNNNNLASNDSETFTGYEFNKKPDNNEVQQQGKSKNDVDNLYYQDYDLNNHNVYPAEINNYRVDKNKSNQNKKQQIENFGTGQKKSSSSTGIKEESHGKSTHSTESGEDFSIRKKLTLQDNFEQYFEEGSKTFYNQLNNLNKYSTTLLDQETLIDHTQLIAEEVVLNVGN